MLNAYDLARRDPAFAVLMGAISGADFGAQAMVAPSYPPYAQYEEPAAFGDEYGFGISAFDPTLNLGFGAGAPAAHPAAHPAHPANAHLRASHPAAHPAVAAAHHAAAAHAWNSSPHNPTSTWARSALLDPNRDSTVKVERYSFSFSPTATLVLGTASNIPTFTQQPSTSIKGQRVLANAPMEGFITLSSLQVANVNVFVGGVEDAFTYNPRAQGVMLDLPRLDPQNRATAAGAYSGALPPGFTAGNAFTFVITLQGPATLAGGYGQ